MQKSQIENFDFAIDFGKSRTNVDEMLSDYWSKSTKTPMILILGCGFSGKSTFALRFAEALSKECKVFFESRTEEPAQDSWDTLHSPSLSALSRLQTAFVSNNTSLFDKHRAIDNKSSTGLFPIYDIVKDLDISDIGFEELNRGIDQSINVIHYIGHGIYKDDGESAFICVGESIASSRLAWIVIAPLNSKLTDIFDNLTFALKTIFRLLLAVRYYAKFDCHVRLLEIVFADIIAKWIKKFLIIFLLKESDDDYEFQLEARKATTIKQPVFETNFLTYEKIARRAPG